MAIGGLVSCLAANISRLNDFNLKNDKMTELKNKVNKAATFRELKEIAEKRYENSYESDLCKEEFMNGAEALFKLLRLGGVSSQREQLPKRLSNEAYNKAKEMPYENVVRWWDKQKV